MGCEPSFMCLGHSAVLHFHATLWGVHRLPAGIGVPSSFLEFTP
jgi:hypothetical protein